MKYISKITASTFVVALFTFASCDSKPAETTGNTNTEDLVDGADGGLDSLDLPNDTTNSSSTPVVE